MEITIKFDSMDEFEDFRSGGDGNAATDKPKRTRQSRKAGAAEAPDPAAVPQTLTLTTGQLEALAPTMPGAASTGFPAAFPGAAPVGSVATGPSPEVLALVQRIDARCKSALEAKHPEADMVNWFREQCGPESAQATLDQIKQLFLPRLSVDQLTNIAKLMGA